MILADDYAKAEYVCADFMGQLEHGPDSQAILITTSSTMASAVATQFEKQLRTLEERVTYFHRLQKARLLFAVPERGIGDGKHVLLSI